MMSACRSLHIVQAVPPLRLLLLPALAFPSRRSLSTSHPLRREDQPRSPAKKGEPPLWLVQQRVMLGREAPRTLPKVSHFQRKYQRKKREQAELHRWVKEDRDGVFQQQAPHQTETRPEKPSDRRPDNYIAREREEYQRQNNPLSRPARQAAKDAKEERQESHGHRRGDPREERRESFGQHRGGLGGERRGSYGQCQGDPRVDGRGSQREDQLEREENRPEPFKQRQDDRDGDRPEPHSHRQGDRNAARSEEHRQRSEAYAQRAVDREFHQLGFVPSRYDDEERRIPRYSFKSGEQLQQRKTHRSNSRYATEPAKSSDESNPGLDRDGIVGRDSSLIPATGRMTHSGRVIPYSPRKLMQMHRNKLAFPTKRDVARPPHLQRRHGIDVKDPLQPDGQVVQDDFEYDRPVTKPGEGYNVPAEASDQKNKEAARAQRFDTFPMHPGLLIPLGQKFGTSALTMPIQSLSLAHFLPSHIQPSRTLLAAETGSGKTLAYLLPLLHHLKLSENPKPTLAHQAGHLLPRSIVLSPSHELTRQSTRFAKLLCHNVKAKIVGMSNTKDGGTGGETGTVDVLLGTGDMVRKTLGVPKAGEEVRGVDMKHSHSVAPDMLDWVVIDEADVLLGPDFASDTLQALQSVLSSRPRVSLILCTATVPPYLLNLLTTHPLFAATPFTQILSPGLHQLPRNTTTTFVPPTGSGNQLTDVAYHLKRTFAEDAAKRKEMGAAGRWQPKTKAIVFVNSDAKAARLSKVLEDKGLRSLVWTGTGVGRKRGSDGELGAFLVDPGEEGRKARLREKKEKGESGDVMDHVETVDDSSDDALEDEVDSGQLLSAPSDESHMDDIDVDEPAESVSEDETEDEADRTEYDDEDMEADLEEDDTSTQPTTDTDTEPSQKPTSTDPASSIGSPASPTAPPEPRTPRVLIATSLLSRGLDFSPHVSTVLLVDQPRDILDFVHRAGRTGRGGRKGRVLVFEGPRGPRGGRELDQAMKGVVGQGPKVKVFFREARERKRMASRH